MRRWRMRMRMNEFIDARDPLTGAAPSQVTAPGRRSPFRVPVARSLLENLL